MKNIITSIIAIVGLTVFATPAFAATTATLSPADISVVAGQSFSVAISVNPNGTANYAEKVEIKYPADMLEVRGFNFAASWTALNQPGYDVTDNVNGSLIKTAGYASGFTGATSFGTISFYAKKTGTAPISIGSNSLAFEASSQTAITGTPVTITIGTPTRVELHTTEETVQVAPIAEVSETPTSTSDITAAAGDTTEGNMGLYITLGIVAIIVIAGVVYFVTKKA